MDDAGYGFWPGRREWATGVRHYLGFLPVGFPLGLALGVIRFGPLPPAWRVAGTFLGILWVVVRDFPNWRFALMAAVAGLFYGLAFRAAGSIRASMVTHALVVATWRALFV
jgi:hypothetical protein